MKRFFAIILVFVLFTVSVVPALAEDVSKEELKKMQRRLVELGYMEERQINGKYSVWMRDALTHFQSWNVLEITGNYNEETYNLLMSDKAMAYPKNLGMTSSDLINELSRYRQIVNLPAITSTIPDFEKNARAVNIMIDDYNAIVITQCGEMAVEFIMIGSGDGSLESGSDILLTFSGGMAVTNKSITNKEAYGYMYNMASEGKGKMSIDGVNYTFSRSEYFGNLLTVRPE